MTKGTIFNIQKYSVHDGPGIRTTVFFKGCPLNCWWCHNPESQSLLQEIMYMERRCTICSSCVDICQNGALNFKNGKIEYIRERCILCGDCVSKCLPKARELAGKTVTAEYLMKEIHKDQIFYDESCGGVTFSGGEPLMQMDFLYELLKMCKEEGLHTTLDTSGFSTWESLEKIKDLVDLFLYDIKLMDSEKHKKYTGVSNDLILKNIISLSENHCRIFARMPIIPGINDDDENICSSGEFLSHLNIEQVNILPYHNIGIDKYIRLYRNYSLIDIKVPSDESILKISHSLEEYGLNIKIGG